MNNPWVFESREVNTNNMEVGLGQTTRGSSKCEERKVDI